MATSYVYVYIYDYTEMYMYAMQIKAVKAVLTFFSGYYFCINFVNFFSFAEFVSTVNHIEYVLYNACTSLYKEMGFLKKCTKEVEARAKNICWHRKSKPKIVTCDNTIYVVKYLQ